MDNTVQSVDFKEIREGMEFVKEYQITPKSLNRSTGDIFRFRMAIGIVNTIILVLQKDPYDLFSYPS